MLVNAPEPCPSVFKNKPKAQHGLVAENGVPFSKEICLKSQKVSGERARFSGEFERALKAIRAEMYAKKVPADYRLDVVLNDAKDTCDFFGNDSSVKALDPEKNPAVVEFRS